MISPSDSFAARVNELNSNADGLFGKMITSELSELSEEGKTSVKHQITDILYEYKKDHHQKKAAQFLCVLFLNLDVF